MRLIVQTDGEHLRRGGDTGKQLGSVHLTVGSPTLGGCLMSVQFLMPGDGRHRVGQRGVTGQCSEIVPLVASLESGSALNVQESKHLAIIYRLWTFRKLVTIGS